MKKRDIHTGAALILGAALIAGIGAPLASSAANLSSTPFAVKAQNTTDSTRFAIKPFFSATSAPTAPPTTAPPTTPPVVANPASDFTWTTTASQATVKKYTGTAASVVIPSSYSLNGVDLPVTSITANAFSGTPIESAVIPSTMSSIGTSAFQGAASLKAVAIPDSVVSIGPYAFYGVPLDSVTLPSALTSIGVFAFYATNISSLTLPDSLTAIGGSAFKNSRISTLRLPSKLKSVDSWAFSGNLLTTVTIPSTVTSLGDSAFFITNLSSVYFEGNAPTTFSAASSSTGTFGAAAGKTIYYKAASTGFTSPWKGYATATY